ncbi:MAG: hypothetical protein HOP18_07480 [Deltaproteobacteria bacterium]|nr:hypothetical protein [Deltaproteobacteria bacterium]
MTRSSFLLKSRQWLLAVSALLWAWPGSSVAETVRHHDEGYLVYRIDPRTDQLRLLWQDPHGDRFGSFRRVRDALAIQGQQLLFAMNAGIFSTAYAPLGLHIEDGRILHPLNNARGWGNFFLKPNGVFFIANHKAAVVDTTTYATLKVKPDLATQSGPLLVTQGKLPPKFLPDSLSLYLRNGVGVTEDNQVVFAMSLVPINLHEFATLFRDTLGCPNALYLDGSISQLYAPSLGQEFLGGDFAGILVHVR